MVNEPVLVDTGPLIALYSEEDAHHAACFEQMTMLPLGKVYNLLARHHRSILHATRTP